MGLKDIPIRLPPGGNVVNLKKYKKKILQIILSIDEAHFFAVIQERSAA